jgi:hypothetical protein
LLLTRTLARVLLCIQNRSTVELTRFTLRVTDAEQPMEDLVVQIETLPARGVLYFSSIV